MTAITISRKLAPKDDLIVIPKKEFDALIARAGDVVTEQDVLHWSRDAKKMYRRNGVSHHCFQLGGFAAKYRMAV